MYLYLLTNTAREPQKLYVGITSRPMNTRLLEHFNTASKKTTPIARALKKYGREAFTLTVLGQAESWEELCAMEQAAIVHYNTLVPHGYNLTQGGGGTIGYTKSPESIEKTRQANLGSVRSQAFRDAVGARMRGVPKSPEQRAKMGEWQRGENNSQYGKTPAHLPKMLAAIAKIREEKGDPRKGRTLSDARKAEMSQALKGRTYSDAERAAHEAQYDAMRGQPKSEETRAKISAKTLEQFARQGNPMQGRTHSAETKEKIAAKRRGKPGANKGKKLGPLSDETKAKLSAALQGHRAWNEGLPWHEITGGKEHPKARAVEYNGVVYASVMACHVQTGLARNTIRLYIKQGKAKYMPNTILTTGLAGIVQGGSMPDAGAPAESQKYPAYRHHYALPMILILSEAEEHTLPAGYRATPYTEEEADAAVQAAAAAAEQPETQTRRSHR